MYQIRKENVEDLKFIKLKSYAEILEISDVYVINIFSGKHATKAPIAKGIISIAFGIPIKDIQMDKLLKKYFKKVK